MSQFYCCYNKCHNLRKRKKKCGVQILISIAPGRSLVSFVVMRGSSFQSYRLFLNCETFFLHGEVHVQVSQLGRHLSNLLEHINPYLSISLSILECFFQGKVDSCGEQCEHIFCSGMKQSYGFICSLSFWNYKKTIFYVQFRPTC